MKKNKELILDKALELFNNQGVANVSIRQIAAEINISHSNLIYHFKTKNDIIIALHQQLLDKAQELNKQTKESANFIETLFHSTHEGFRVLYEYRFFMIEIIHITRESEAIKQIFLEVEKIRATMYREAINMAVQLGIMRKELYENEYENFIQHIKIYSDAWISSSQIYDTSSIEQIIEKYSLLFIKMFFPYLTEKGKEDFLKLK
jgi:AcrR family transcriptional regulator